MSQTTQEVRTKFVWDTADADAGVKRIERAFDRLKQADSSAKKATKHTDNNTAMGFRDLAEGRGVNAMQRFGHAIGATAGRVVFYMAALKAASEATRFLVDEVKQYNAESNTAHDRFTQISRSTLFSTSGESANDLLSKRQQINEASDKETKLQGDTLTTGGMIDDLKNRPVNKANPFSVLFGAASSLVGQGAEKAMGIAGMQTPKEARDASEARQKALAKQNEQLTAKVGESLTDQSAIATMKAPGDYNDPFEAKRRELEIEEKIEMSRAQALNISKADQELITQRYDTLRRTVQAEKDLMQSRADFARSQVALEGGPQGSFRKGLGLANGEFNQSNSLLSSGNLTQEQRNAELLNRDKAANRIQSSVMGRYLNSDGTNRREGDIQKDFRTDAQEQRNRARFIKRFASGGYDPVTGRRRATGDRTGGGLRSGGLATGGLTTGGLGAPAFDVFRKDREPSEKQKQADRDSKTTGDLWQLLQERLPKPTTN